MTTWASTGDVSDITGQTVTDAQLAQAQSVIDIYSNRTVAASGGLSTRDLYWLKQALAWQAAWQAQQAGYTAQRNVETASNDGQSFTYPAEHGVTLAPLAARALRNLSWKGTRTRRVPNAAVPRGVGAVELVDYSRESTDGAGPWTPMGHY